MPIISLSETKDYLKIEQSFTDDDQLITTIINGVGDYIDKRLNRHLHTNEATEGIPLAPDGWCFVIPRRDAIPKTGIYTNIQIYHNDDERKQITPGKETPDGPGHYLQLDPLTGYIIYPPLDEERKQIEDKYNLACDYTPLAKLPEPPGAIKSAALVLAHSLYSNRTTAFAAEQNNLADKFLMPYRNLI